MGYKGSWSRVKDKDGYDSNYDNIFGVEVIITHVPDGVIVRSRDFGARFKTKKEAMEKINKLYTKVKIKEIKEND